MNDTPDPDCIFTLALPQTLEEEALDLLLAHPEWVPGVTVTAGEGFGRQVQLPSVMEQIRGRARRCVLTVLMRQADVAPLVAALQAAFPHPQAAWWTAPLSGFGRLA